MGLLFGTAEKENKNKNNMDIKKIIDQTEKMQNEMHEFITEMRKDPRYNNIQYDVMKDVYFMMKISQLQEQIEILKKQKK